MSGHEPLPAERGVRPDLVASLPKHYHVEIGERQGFRLTDLLQTEASISPLIQFRD